MTIVALSQSIDIADLEAAAERLTEAEAILRRLRLGPEALTVAKLLWRLRVQGADRGRGGES